jgi:antitoxin PrlF
MASATITTKGQITIPKEVRESLKLNVGDKIEFVLTDKREALIRPVSNKVDDVFGLLHRAGQKAISVASMNDSIKQRLKNHFK